MLTYYRMVDVAGRKGSTHGHISVEGEINWFWKEVSQFIPETLVTPPNDRTPFNQVLQVRIGIELLLTDVFKLDKDHLGVVVFYAVDDWDPDLRPLGDNVRSREDNEDSST